MDFPKREPKPVSVFEQRLLRDVGKRIVELASKKKKSIELLAYEAGVSKGYLYDIIKGKGNPSLIILSRISEALDTDINILLNINRS